MSAKYSYGWDEESESRQASLIEAAVNNALDNLKVPDTIDSDEAWVKFTGKLNSDNRKKINVKLSLLIYVMAACALILVSLGISYNFFNYRTIDCPNGKQMLVYLPDKSRVHINSGSKLSYKYFGWKKNREVHLNGEAFFEVKKGRSFRVVTEKGSITVLGTSFNVYARNQILNVACRTGKVAVVCQNEIILRAGEGCQLDKVSQQLEIYKPSIEKKTGWIAGKFWFERALLTEVFNEIERQFNVTVSYSDTTRRYFTGYFTNKDLNEALKVVCTPMQLDYSVSKERIIIK